MRLIHSASTAIITASVVVVVAITVVGNLMTSRLVKAGHEADYDLMRHAFATALKAAEEDSAADADIVANMPAVKRAFGARDRAALEAETVTMFKTVSPKYAVDQATFHTPPGNVFLRLHDPAKFGDDQSATNAMLAEAQHEKAARQGIVIAKKGPGVFAIVPVVDDKGQFAGTFSMGFDFDPVMKDLKTAYGVECAAYFEEKSLREVATDIEPETMQPHNRVGRYIRTYATSPDLMASLVTDRDIEITEAKSFERSAARVPWGVQLIPIYNFAHKQIGVVALATNFEEETTIQRRSILWQMLAAVVALVVISGVVFISIRGLLLRPLAALTVRMKALADGDASQPAEPYEDYCDELEALAKSYERLRETKKS